MPRKKKPRGRKWKFADFAKKKRYCERCMKHLKKSESKICHTCYIELLAGNTGEVNQ